MISQEAVEDANNAPAFTDEVEAAVLLLPRALDALEAANREIERLGDALEAAMNPPPVLCKSCDSLGWRRTGSDMSNEKAYIETVMDAIEKHMKRRPSYKVAEAISKEIGLTDLINCRTIRDSMNAPIEFNNPEDWSAT